MKNIITIIVTIIVALIFTITIYVLFNTFNKTTENYSNTNVSLKPTDYNSTKCKPKNDEVQYTIAYNDYCNM